jgi:hypothetical protein
MLNTINTRAASVGDTVFTVSRQAWLAGLGAAAMTRDWAENEAGAVFRNLIKEGTVVETRAMRFVGDRLEGSFNRANTLWHKARRTMTSTVRTYADTAVTIVRDTLPRSLPKVGLPVSVKVKAAPKRKLARARKAAKARTTATVKRAKRTVKSAAKRV